MSGNKYDRLDMGDSNSIYVRDLDEKLFEQAFGMQSQDVLEKMLTREQVIAIINHPDTQMHYGVRRNDSAHRRYLESADVDDLIGDILGEGFDTQTLINVIREVLGKK